MPYKTIRVSRTNYINGWYYTTAYTRLTCVHSDASCAIPNEESVSKDYIFVVRSKRSLAKSSPIELRKISVTSFRQTSVHQFRSPFTSMPDGVTPWTLVVLVRPTWTDDSQFVLTSVFRGRCVYRTAATEDLRGRNSLRSDLQFSRS